MELNEGEKPKHVYTVEITRAVFSLESMEVFKKYQMSIHDDKDKTRSGYERFLCQVPLFDPNDT